MSSQILLSVVKFNCIFDAFEYAKEFNDTWEYLKDLKVKN